MSCTLIFGVLYNFVSAGTALLLAICVHALAAHDWITLSKYFFIMYGVSLIASIMAVSFTNSRMGGFLQYQLKWSPIKYTQWPKWLKVVNFIVLPLVTVPFYASAVHDALLGFLFAAIAPFTIAAITRTEGVVPVGKEHVR